MATIGQVGNLDHENVTVGKAGRSRWRGIRPTVRGTAMNPVDHPMGGEGTWEGQPPYDPVEQADQGRQDTAAPARRTGTSSPAAGGGE